MYLSICFGIILIFLNSVSCSSNCFMFLTCSECISYAREKCVWCSKDDLAGKRCQSFNYYENNESWCDAKFITNPEPKTAKVTVNKPFNSDSKATVQLRPQVIQISARPGIPVNFTVTYQPAKDYALDVYYLMDNSFTMEKNLKDLYEQANEIYKALKNLTNNVRLGVGGFIEKRLYPFYDAREKLKTHSEIYAFKNQLSLTDNITKFIDVVRNTKFGGNFDGPEAGFDALMQAMTCLKEIGWRKDSRRIIVLCTDSTYHSAGDGKMLGIIKPNDMKCHLEDNIYSMDTKLDYPSVSQINTVASNGVFQILFAIKLSEYKDVDQDYKHLVKQITGAKYAELKDKSYIVEMIKTAYLDSVRGAEMHVDNDDWFDITFDQDCKSESKRNCILPAINAALSVNATLKLKRCSGSSKFPQIFIHPVHISEKLLVQVQSDCTCDCEKTNFGDKKFDAKCNNAGFLQCGICKCDPFKYGTNCQCNVTSTHTNNMDDIEKCKAHPDDQKVCSGEGTCNCGTCTCSKKFSGVHCEFNEDRCPKTLGNICNNKGECIADKCKCNEFWKEPDCACPTHDNDCIAPYSKEICSGNGVCECGKCVCNKVKGKDEFYSGVFCDSCTDCTAKYCKQIENYAHCNYINEKNICDEMPEFNKTVKTHVEIVNKTDFEKRDIHQATLCKTELDDGSFLLFKYYHDQSHELHLKIQKEPELPSKANLWVAAGSALLAVILIGLATLIGWKILIDLHDKREYKKFEEQSREAGFDVSLNPLYQDPAFNYTNPIYNSNSTE